jgi:single-stranded-DNA-specific exonuclease
MCLRVCFWVGTLGQNQVLEQKAEERRHKPMSARRKQWKLCDPAPPDVVENLGCGEIVATLLHQRKVYDATDAALFLETTYPGGLHDPFLMKGMQEASTRLAHAIAEGEPIAVYGDFDTDGVTSVTLLYQALSQMGGTVVPYIPHRTYEGYGLNVEAVEQLATQGVRLIVTVDCGISNVDEVARAVALGVDVIVTDHHTPPANLPPAHAIVNPKQPGCAYPFKQLVGVGIAFKLVWALKHQGLRPIPRGRDMLELVALGTVADLGPLTGENRVLVKAGLEAINITERPGLLALIGAAGLPPGQVDAMGIAFRLAPRLNAAGRMDDAAQAYNLLMASTQETAQELADELNQANSQRQQVTEQVFAAARALGEETSKHQQPIVMLDSTDYPAGVVGLVAARLVEAWQRPVILIERGEQMSRGSARSIPGFNIIDALTRCKDLFARFGGHSMAAGFTLATNHLPNLEACLHNIAATTLTEDMFVPTLDVHVTVDINDVNWNLFHDLARLEPFGSNNPQPHLLSESLVATDIRTIGTNEQHLKFRLGKNGGRTEEAVAFGLGHLAAPLRKHPTIDVVYTLESHEWNDIRSLQLNVKDFRRTSKKSQQRG